MTISNLTLEELERKEYIEGNIELAKLYSELEDKERRIDDLEDALND